MDIEDRGQALLDELAKVQTLPDTPKNRRHKRSLERRIKKYFTDPIYSAERLNYYGVTFEDEDIVIPDRTYTDDAGETQYEPGMTIKGHGRIRVTLGGPNTDQELAMLSDKLREQSWRRRDERKIRESRQAAKIGVKESPDDTALLGIPRLGRYFRDFGDRDPHKYAGPVTALDIETGSGERPISIAAVKGYVDKNTGEFLYTQAFERYYVPQKPWEQVYNMAKETHHITPARALEYRRQQGATYSETYNAEEKEQLLTFLKGSVITGHNITGFDFRNLDMANEAQDFRVIDTWIAAENLGIPLGKQNLRKLYTAFTGRTPEEADLNPHASFDDVLAQLGLFSQLFARGDTVGRDIRFISSNGGYSYAPYEEVVDSGVVKGGYRKALEVKNYMEGETINEKMGIVTDEEGNPIKTPDGISVQEDPVKKLDKENFDEQTQVTAIGVTEKLLIGLTTAMHQVKDAMTEYVNTQNQPLVQYLSNRSAEFAKDYLEKKGVRGEQQNRILELAGDLREEKENERYGDLDKYVQDLVYIGKLSKERGDWYQEVIAGGPLYTSKELKQLIQSDVRRETYDRKQAEIKERQAKAKERQDEIDKKIAEDEIWYDIKNEYDLNKYTEKLNEEWRDEPYKKYRYVEQAQKRGLISQGDADELMSSAEYLAGSYDDLINATDDLIESNQRLLKVYQEIGKIKPYDVNQYLQSAKNQWGGITGAASGVVPNIFLNPIKRIGNAVFNYQEGVLAPLNAIQRTWNSGIGNALMGITATGGALIGGVPGAIIGGGIGQAVSGGFNAITQIAGNSAQAQMEVASLSIQNTLNSLGAMISWISAPFQLLHKATKLLTGSFSGLTWTLNNFMKNGISDMTQMGNPLTELTGVNYSAYAGTTMMDVASLFNQGSMNSIYEDFAKQQRAFYTLGQVNTNRLIASSMLGVYDHVYGTSTDTESTYNSMVNKLLVSMQGQTEDQLNRTMYLASEIDNNLPALLRTANMLGVTDISQLTNPGNRGVYWRPIDDTVKDKNGLTEAGRFRWTQYEFGAATAQFGYSKMRLADTVWRAVGKDLYNGINEVVDKLSTGNWEGALNAAADMWEKFKGKVSVAWERIKDVFKGKEGEGGWGHAFKAIGLQISRIALDVAETITNIWNTIMSQLLRKSQDLIAYLSTVSVTPHIDKQTGRVSFEINSIGTAQGYDEDTKNKVIYSRPDYLNVGKQEMSQLNAADGMQAFADIVDTLHPDWTPFQKYTYYYDKNLEDLQWEVGSYLASGNNLDLSEYGYNIPGGFMNMKGLNALFDSLLRAGEKGMGPYANVAAQTISDVPDNWKVKGYSDSTGLYSGAEKLINDFSDITGTTIDILRDKLDSKIEIEIKAIDDRGKVSKAVTTVGEGISNVSKSLLRLPQIVVDMFSLEVQKVGGGS